MTSASLGAIAFIERAKLYSANIINICMADMTMRQEKIIIYESKKYIFYIEQYETVETQARRATKTARAYFPRAPLRQRFEAAGHETRQHSRETAKEVAITHDDRQFDSVNPHVEKRIISPIICFQRK